MDRIGVMLTLEGADGAGGTAKAPFAQLCRDCCGMKVGRMESVDCRSI